jgi:hypothetical protein
VSTKIKIYDAKYKKSVYYLRLLLHQFLSLPHLRLVLLLITSLSLNPTHNLNNTRPQPLHPNPLFLPPNFHGHPILTYHRLPSAVDKYIRPILLFPALRLFCNVLLRLVQRRTLDHCFYVDAYARGVFDYLLNEIEWR